MTPNEFRTLVYQKFMEHWDIGPISLYTFDNEKFTPPDPESPLTANSGKRWVRLCVRHSDSRQKTIGPVGSRKFEHIARVVLQIFTVPNTGTNDPHGLNRALPERFHTNLTRRDACRGQSSYRERGTAEGWYMAEATVTYTYDEIR